ncbi:T-lymphocyte surface antigen Ly-9-like [Anarhichas minor]|uniref:T-lymphocyte surface antigen Ly-9-like n=1 Tax=Anarhichas minor TaxID=65739 RepID=UPI003F7331B3
MEKLTGLCVLLAALSLAVTEDKFFTEGGSITLNVRPYYPDPIKHILWKFGGDLLAEWNKDDAQLEFYRSFKGRTTLDTTNGRLVVNRMSKNDTGVYSVEINGKVTENSVSYTAKWIITKHVPEPVVVIRTACTASSEECIVSCDGDTTEAEPVTYSWKMGDKDWELLGKSIEITVIKNAHDKFITCRMTNSFSEKVSETIINPFYRINPVWIVGIVFGVLGALILLALVGLWKYRTEQIRERLERMERRERLERLELLERLERLELLKLLERLELRELREQGAAPCWCSSWCSKDTSTRD